MSSQQNIWDRIQRDLWIGLAFVVLFLVLPAFDPGKYFLTQITLFFIWAAVVTQWNLVFGVGGIFSLGHMAIFAIGGYVMAMMGLYNEWNLWAAMIVGGITAVIFSFLMGVLTLRLRGPYVAVMTLALAQVMHALIVTDVECYFKKEMICINFTGGAKGIMKFGDFGFKDWLGYKYVVFGNYYLALALLVIGSIFAFSIMYSSLGATFRAVRDHTICAETRGVDRRRAQLLLFSVSGFFTGLAGGVYGGIYRTVGPDTLTLPVLLFLLSMMVIGGRGTHWGPVLGAGALMLADTTLRGIGDFRIAGLSLIIILSIIFLPRGLVGLVYDIFHWKPRSLIQFRERSVDLRKFQRDRKTKKFNLRYIGKTSSL